MKKNTKFHYQKICPPGKANIELAQICCQESNICDFVKLYLLIRMTTVNFKYVFMLVALFIGQLSVRCK
jgi:hypothetical protein